MPTYEIDQATGARTRILMAKETLWGNVSTSANFKSLNVLAGETLDENTVVYGSNVIRSDRMRNKDVRGTQRPGGGLPFELAPKGVSQFLWHLLGGSVVTAGSGPYTHTIKGATSLPQGFSLEKGFLDLATPEYFLFTGCRVNAMSLNFSVDQIVSGAFDILARAVTGSATSALVSTAADLTYDPFTSVQVTLYEGSSLVPIGTAQSLALTITNNLVDAFVLGSNFRANLKPGQRNTRFSGVFLFNNTDLYDKALDGTDTKLQITCSDGTYSVDFYMGNVDLLPSGSLPKISTDGPLVMPINGIAAKDDVEGTDIKITLVSPEATIDT